MRKFFNLNFEFKFVTVLFLNSLNSRRYKETKAQNKQTNSTNTNTKRQNKEITSIQTINSHKITPI